MLILFFCLLWLTVWSDVIDAILLWFVESSDWPRYDWSRAVGGCIVICWERCIAAVWLVESSQLSCCDWSRAVNSRALIGREVWVPLRHGQSSPSRFRAVVDEWCRWHTDYRSGQPATSLQQRPGHQGEPQVRSTARAIWEGFRSGPAE